MSEINIPPEALQEAWETYIKQGCGPHAFEAAIRAMLAAWPGVKTKLANSINVEPREQYLILPLTEPRDDAV